MTNIASARISELTVNLTGDIDLASAPALTDRLADALSSRPAVLVLDGSGVTFIDSTGLAALIAVANEASVNGVAVRLVRPSDRLVRLLELTGTDWVVGYPNERAPA